MLLDGAQPFAADLLSGVGVLGIPVAVAIAVLKYGLYDIDRRLEDLDRGAGPLR